MGLTEVTNVLFLQPFESLVRECWNIILFFSTHVHQSEAKNCSSYWHLQRRSVICIFSKIRQYLTKHTMPWFPKDITLSNIKVWAKSIFHGFPSLVWILQTSTLNTLPFKISWHPCFLQQLVNIGSRNNTYHSYTKKSTRHDKLKKDYHMGST